MTAVVCDGHVVAPPRRPHGYAPPSFILPTPIDIIKPLLEILEHADKPAGLNGAAQAPGGLDVPLHVVS